MQYVKMRHFRSLERNQQFIYMPYLLGGNFMDICIFVVGFFDCSGFFCVPSKFAEKRERECPMTTKASK